MLLTQTFWLQEPLLVSRHWSHCTELVWVAGFAGYVECALGEACSQVGRGHIPDKAMQDNALSFKCAWACMMVSSVIYYAEGRPASYALRKPGDSLPQEARQRVSERNA